MNFHATPIRGAYVIELDRQNDDRGYFARAFCREEFAARGLRTDIVQANTSLSRRRHTLRGLHYQLPPAAEVKIVRCTRGAVHDVILDLRRSSATFGKHFGMELSADNGRGLYVPEGFAHGYLTLTDNAEVFYLVTAAYRGDCERGIRWDDPKFAIDWPARPAVISEKDAALPDFDEAWHLGADARQP